MLFWLFVIILAVGVGLLVFGSVEWKGKHAFLYRTAYGFQVAGVTTVFLSGVAILICVTFLINQFLGVNARIEQKRENYRAIAYKVESGACRDDLGLLNKEVVDEIQEWNEDIVYYQNVQRDFWIGIFYPNVYDDFETIDYEKYRRE